MASDADIIKEYLVSLGFTLDNKSLKIWNTWMGTATKFALGFAASASAAAAGTVAFVAKVSEGLDSLYWASQRIKAGVANIQGFEYAIANMGGSVEGALGSLEGLASFLRSNPGAEGFLGSLGIATRDQNGALLDRVKVMEQLAQRFRQMPFYIAKAYASFMGIDEMTLMAMRRGTGGFTNRFNQLYGAAGVSADAMASASHDFMVQMRTLKTDATVLAEYLAYKLLPGAKDLVAWVERVTTSFISWLNSKDAQTLGSAISTLGSTIWKLAGTLGDWGAKVLTFMNLGTWDRLSQIINSLAGTLDAINDLLTGNWKGLKKHGQQFWSDTSTFIGDTLQKWGVSKVHVAKGGSIEQALAYFRKQGWSAAQAAGIVSNLFAESGLRTGAVGDSGKAVGIAQWHADRQAAFKKLYGKDILHASLAEQLAFVNHELTKGAEQHAGALLKLSKDAYHAAGVVAKFYERPADANNASVLRGNLANQIFDQARLGTGKTVDVKIEQKNETHVHTRDEPKAIGREVHQAHKRTNGDLLRNLKGATR